MTPPLNSDELVALNRLTLVARVFAGTAHDVNNALQIISGSAELLASSGDTSAPARRAVERIQAQSARAAGALQEMLQFARDRGEASSRVSLRDVASKAIALRMFQIRRAGLALAFDAEAAPQAVVTGASVRLQQAVLNLIINAEQALQGIEGGVISVELAETADGAVLRVIDNGRGLDPVLADRAFEPFVTTRPVADASGLGLAASRIIARDLGGDITFDPRASGSCTVLRLPLAAH
jgi:C4-dicarboxylate-specific signal transduction histidine kinase